MHHPACPRRPRKLPVDLATWSLRPGNRQACVLLNMPALRLTWSDPRPRDRAARTGQRGPAWLAPFVRNTSLSRPGQARLLATPVQLIHLHRHPPAPSSWHPSARPPPGLAGQVVAMGKHPARGVSLAAPGPSHHRPFSLRPKDLPHPSKSSSLPGGVRGPDTLPLPGAPTGCFGLRLSTWRAPVCMVLIHLPQSDDAGPSYRRRN